MLNKFLVAWLSIVLSLVLPPSAFSVRQSALQEEPRAQKAIATTSDGIADSELIFQAPGVAITEHKMTGGPIPAGCAPPSAKFRFATTDSIAYQWTAAAGAAAGDIVRWEWIRPDGSMHRTDQLTFSVSGNVCFSAGLFIAGQQPATLPGDWKVNVYYNDTRMLFEIFTIGGEGPRLCPRPVQAVYEGAFRLGSAAGRSSCAQSRPLDASTAALIAEDLRRTISGLELASPCVQFDLSSLRSLLARVSGLTGDQASRELNQLGQDLILAVRRAGLRSDQVGPTSFEGLIQAAVSIGTLSARITCPPCQDPLPPATVTEVNMELARVAQLLRPYASCIPGFDFRLFSDRRVGAPASAVQTSYDLIALATAIQSAVCNADCCFTCSGTPAPVGTVRGTVRNAANNQPISGATVSVAGTGQTATASDGSYSLGNVPAGQQTLNGSATGFMPAQVMVTVVANQTVMQDILLTPITQTGMVRGTVRNAANNQPIAGASVSVAGTNITATSASDGAYVLNNAPAGQQTLNGSAAGFMSAQVVVMVVANQAVTQDIRLTPLAQTGTVQGTVRNGANSQPIPGATVAVAGTSLTANSGNDGAYAMANVPAGPQTLNASAPGFTSAQVMVTVVAGQAVTQIILLMPLPVGTITGTVRNASNGQAIAGASISVAGLNISTNSAGSGIYTISNVPSGEQTLNASATGFISTQVKVTVVAGQTVTQNISLSPILASGEIRITLNWNKDNSGSPDDLDMHLAGPNPDGSSCFHIFFFDPGRLNGAPFAQLEVDNIELNGHPPTETVRISRLTPGIYRFFIHNFGGESPDGISRSRATVQVFSGTGLVFSATAPTASGAFWNVFTMNGQTGAITPINTVSNALPPLTPCR